MKLVNTNGKGIKIKFSSSWKISDMSNQYMILADLGKMGDITFGLENNPNGLKQIDQNYLNEKKEFSKKHIRQQEFVLVNNGQKTKIGTFASSSFEYIDKIKNPSLTDLSMHIRQYYFMVDDQIFAVYFRVHDKYWEEALKELNKILDEVEPI
jgi:hypothetical protein